MKPLILSLFDNNSLTDTIAKQLKLEAGKIILHDFPDQETYIQWENSLQNRDVIIFTSLDKPNQKILPLLFAVEAARDLGAKKVGLCCPYLGYMRQDKRFKKGEGITSNYFAKLLSGYFDWLVTIDPHLHRHHNLSEIYSIPSSVLHATGKISEWILQHIKNPVLIGPDAESEQWVCEVAAGANAPYIILEKIRHGDEAVEVSQPAVKPFLEHTPVLVDDIISTARTMIETINHLKKANMKAAVCVGVHAVFAGNSYQSLLQSGAAEVITCNTINHPSNAIDLSGLLIEGIREYL